MLDHFDSIILEEKTEFFSNLAINKGLQKEIDKVDEEINKVAGELIKKKNLLEKEKCCTAYTKRCNQQFS